ncbi:hypothetical protein D1818_17645 [Aquimarina sp. BL5]|uniref:LamG-like jellyroll fold domain-containing protein n=1 Tax=Aquimarina sp. BL5 TaxID=1714860 RepID=UPI000E491BF2|nr:LamG-like jellyroll fold domain-containing protein [Aquimarina sp. BL5]AXT52566.1 hypothetical protein D1818_17645 [Aquimarina sp. BL5]RKN11248.1 hypothetical protein D7036_01150 [Aquimarina sp. BL5]
MKKTLATIKLLCWITLLWLFQWNTMQAQSTNAEISTLKMLGESNYNVHLDTNIGLKKMLLDAGATGQATLEFWTQFQNNTQSLVLTNDASRQKGLTIAIHCNKITLVGENAENQAVTLPIADTEAYWQHVTFAFYKINNQGQYNIDVYLNGNRVKTFNTISITADYDLYFTKGRKNDTVLLTEIRAWNVKRAAEEIRNNMFSSFRQYQESVLDNEINKGLVANYSGDAQPMAENPYLPQLTNLQWNNTIQKEGFPSYGTIVSNVKNNELDINIAFINTTVGNPIDALDEIVMYASKGTYESKIELSWFHIDALSNYQILRDDVEIGSENNVDQRNGTKLSFTDPEALPGTIYIYKIKGSNADGSNQILGNDTGFIFPNGTLAGNIKTQSNVFVQDVGIAIELDSNESIHGTALSFAPNTDNITFLDRNLFTDHDELTIEFWYKHEATNSNAYNTVFQLDDTAIQISASSAVVQYNNQQPEFSLGTPDDQWHHYAYTFGRDGIEVFKDQESIGTHATPFQWSATTEDFSYYLNAEVQYAYSLDEFRVWKGKKDGAGIKKYGPFVSDGDAPDLLIAYSMDLQGANELYNHARRSRGSYLGTTQDDLVYVKQPSTLKYVAFTDENGNYEFSTMFSASSLGDTYTAKAFKPNHEFRPPTRGFTIKKSSIVTDYSKVADFTDISALPIAGRIYYNVNDELFPVPAGRQIAIDGNPQVGIGGGLSSDNAGVYSVSSSLGNHDFEVFNPELNLDQTLHSLSFSPIEADDVITSGGHAVSKRTVNASDQGLTFSGFVKPFISVVYPDYVSEKQTLFSWGDYAIVLKNNELIQFMHNGVLQKETIIRNSTAFTFFALAIDKSGNYGFMVDETYKVGRIGSFDLRNSLLNLGASVNTATGAVTQDNLSHLALIQYRTQSYSEAQLLAIKNGEIIDEDATALELSFEFDQEKGNRAISKTVAGKNNYLQLMDNTTTDATQVVSYTKKYRYTYQPANPRYNPKQDSAKYTINVFEPLTEVDFEMEDRYGFVGNIVIPCDNSIGVWTGTIIRTDSRSPEFKKEIKLHHFDTDNKIFTVDGLIPGKYQVTITNTEDTSITLSSPIIDLTKGWKSYDFEYRAPLSTEIKLYVVKEDKVSLPISELKEEDFDLLQKACDNDFYILGEGNPVLMQVNVFEQYGEEKCQVSDAKVTFSGSLLRLPNDSSSINGTTDEGGNAVLTSFAASPNFIAPHTRDFTIAVSHDNRVLTQKVSGLIEGARMNDSDFTIADPIVNYVLHDPPGDGSSATLKKGTSSTTKGFWSASAGYTGTLSGQFGVAVKQDVVATVFGFGTSLEVANANVTSGVQTEISVKGTYNGSTTNTVTNTEDVSTSSSDNLTGKNADLFIGTGYLITVGSGETLAYDTSICDVVYATNAPVFNNQIDNSFVHSYFDVQRNIIPNLLKAIDNEQDPKQIQSYENSVIKWIEQLTRNDYALNIYNKADYDFMQDHAFLVELYNALPAEFNSSKYNWDNYRTFENFEANRSFDGGGTTFTQSITKSNTLSNGANFESTFDIGYKTVAKTATTGVSASFEYTNVLNTSFGGGFEITNGDDTVLSYTFTDNDAGDRFAVEIKRDPNFAVPIYKTLSGQSSCPAERGTQIRTGVEIAAEKNSADGLTGQTLEYRIFLRNTQIASSPQSYALSLSQSSNPLGAQIKINGEPFVGNARNFFFGPDENSPTGIKQEIEAKIEISVPENQTDSVVEYKDLKFTFSAPCESHSDLGFTHNAAVYNEAGIKSIDVLYLSATFHGPCIDNLEMQSPQENWVVNAASKNKQDFAFTISGVTVDNGNVTLPESLTAIDIEYAIADNNTPRLLQSIKAEDLSTLYHDNAFRLSVDVSGLVDGDYGFRLVPVCGLGEESWRKNIPTPFAYGSISRSAPLLLETNPAQGGLLTEGSITATYDKALDPSTLNSLNIALRGTLGGLPKALVSAEFNQPSDQITIPHGDFLNLPEAYTVEFWVNPTSYPLSQGANLFQKGNNYSLQLLPNGTLNYLSGELGSSTTKSLPLQEWTHVAMIYDGASTLNIYFNGVLVHTDRGFNAFDNDINTEDFIIGGMVSGEGFIGLMDELRIWDTAKSHNAIASSNNKQLLGNEDHLRAYYVFDNNALEVYGFQEAVTDYTNNTRGSTQTGISWIEGDLAAPLLKEQLVQNIPITIATTIDQNTIIITPLNFQEYFLEGANLTAMISGNAVRGVDGNLVQRHDWSFSINKNSVQWEKTNINVSQTIGNTTQIKMLLTNTGGANATYELQGLPEWLSSDVTVESNIDLPAGFEHTLQFTTSAYLNKGTYYANVGVITYNQDGVQTGYEYFTLELDVNCETPDYTFNASQFAFKKEFVAQLTIADAVSEDPNDIVVAYFNDEIRGRGKVTNFNGRQRVLLDVFYNPGEAGNLTFHVWDASNCKEYIGLTEIFAIGNESSEGTISAPVIFETGDIVIKRVPLLSGFQSVSFNSVSNSSTSNLSISDIKGLSNGDQIMTIDGSLIATFDVNGIASGNLSHLDFTKGYTVNSTGNKMMLIQGVEAPIKTDIAIQGDYITNNIGYIPEVMFNTPYALRSLSNRFALGDRISGREGFSEFTEDGWKGSLTHLIPNKAYSIKMQNNGTLNYSGIVGLIDANREQLAKIAAVQDTDQTLGQGRLDLRYLQKAEAKDIVVDTYKYPMTMSVTATIASDLVNTDQEYIVVAKYNGEYRGVAKAVAHKGQIVYFMTVYGNPNEDISFKVVTEDKIYSVDNTLTLVKNSDVGTISKAHPLHLIENTLSNINIFGIDKNPVTDISMLTINPRKTDQYEVSIFNMAGMQVASVYSGQMTVNEVTEIKLDRTGNLALAHLPGGIYLCTLKSSDRVQTLKLVLE